MMTPLNFLPIIPIYFFYDRANLIKKIIGIVFPEYPTWSAMATNNCKIKIVYGERIDYLVR